MQMKEKARNRSRSNKCVPSSSARISGKRLAEIGKINNAYTSNDTDKDRGSSQKPRRARSQKRHSTSQKRPRSTSEHGSCTNLISPSLLSAAQKLEQAFNTPGSPHHTVKRVYVIRFDDGYSNLRNCHKKYTRVLYDRKVGKEGNTRNMKRTATRSPKMGGHSSPLSGKENASSMSPRNRSGDAPAPVLCAGHANVKVDDFERRCHHIENQAINKARGKHDSKLGKSSVSPSENQLRKVPFNQVPEHKMLSREKPNQSSETAQFAIMFEAILKEIEALSPRTERRSKSLEKKTLKEVIESDQSLMAADYTIPPSLINREAVEVLQAIIDYKRKARSGKGRKSCRFSERLEALSQPINSTEWQGLRLPLNYQAKIVREPDLNMAASSSGCGPMCRICHERLGTLVRPCNCRGTMAYVHVDCLQMWLTERGINHCELCHYVFRVIHMPEYRLIPSIGFWYKFSATNEQRKRILIDITLAVVLLPVLICITLFARSCTAPEDDFDEDVEYDEAWNSLVSLLLVYAFRFSTFLVNMAYVGAVFVRINDHLSTWLAWYVNKNVTVVLEERHPDTVRSIGSRSD